MATVVRLFDRMPYEVPEIPGVVRAPEARTYVFDERYSGADMFFTLAQPDCVREAAEHVTYIEAFVFAQLQLSPSMRRIVQHRDDLAGSLLQAICGEVLRSGAKEWQLAPSRYAALALEFRERIASANFFIAAGLQG